MAMDGFKFSEKGSGPDKEGRPSPKSGSGKTWFYINKEQAQELILA